MPKKSKNSIGKFCLSIFLLLIILLGGGAFFSYKWYQDEISAPNSSDESIVKFEIPTGTSTDEIGKILQDQGLIQDLNAWKIYIKINKPSLLADKYAIAKNLSIIDIVEILKVGQKDEVIWITIPEGIRMDETEVILDEKLSNIPEGNYNKDDFNKLIYSPNEFLSTTTSKSGEYILNLKPEEKNLEGFLFPDTYAFQKDITAEQVLVTLLETFMNRTENIEITNGLSFYDNLIIASIVERESSQKEFSGVAGVFLKRIQLNDKLGSDSTVLYILKRWKPAPTAQELLIDDPYNTRLNYGMPPTPIASPGYYVIESSANAEPGEDLFFISDDYGNIYYAKTLIEHNKNICKYITKTCN